MKILVIFTGGTIGSTQIDGSVSTDNEKPYILLRMYRKYGRPDVSFECIAPYQELSENNTCLNICMLARTVRAHISNGYDGIIVTHGTDTLQYTAAALGYIFADTQIPIVMVSSNYVLEDKRSNGLDNFKFAVDFICGKKEEKGVFVSYKNTGQLPMIHMATRVLPHSPYSDSVYSVSGVWDDIISKALIGTDDGAGYVDFGSFLDRDIKDIPWDSGVLNITPYLGMRYPVLSSETKGIMHGAYHSGTICSVSPDLRQFVDAADKLGLDVYVCGAGDGADYESKKIYDSLGFKVLPMASPVAMYMKLWLCVVNGFDRERTRKVMFEWMAGDFVTTE